MIIAVNTGFMGESQPGDEYVFQCLSRLSEKNPQHQFIYLFNRPVQKSFVFSKNVTTVIARPKTTSTLLWKYWYDYSLPALLKKYKANVWVSMNGICCLRTKLPQCLFIQDLSFLLNPRTLKRSHKIFLNKFTPRFLVKAKTVVVTSHFLKSVIIDRYKTAPDKIDVVYGGIDEIFKPIAQLLKEMIKEKYTEGTEFFLSPASSNLINLLKAFSFFKKRQKSNMKLLITGNPGEPFKEELKTFKFRNEVRLLEDVSKEDLAKITAAAYAMVHPALYDAYAMAPLQAMQCEVPVVCSKTDALAELCGNAAVYFDPGDFEDIAEKMMIIFKEEDKAKELVKAGKIRSRLYDWDKTAGLLWQSVDKAVNN